MSHFSQLFSDNTQVALALRTSCGREAGMPVTALLDRLNVRLVLSRLNGDGPFRLMAHRARDSSRGWIP